MTCLLTLGLSLLFSLCWWCQVLKENTLYFFTKPRVRALTRAVIICVNCCQLATSSPCRLWITWSNTLKSIQPETFRTWTQSRPDGKRMQNTRIHWFSCFNKALLLVQGATVKAAVSSASKHKYGILIKPVSLVLFVFSFFLFSFCFLFVSFFMFYLFCFCFLCACLHPRYSFTSMEDPNNEKNKFVNRKQEEHISSTSNPRPCKKLGCLLSTDALEAICGQVRAHA